MDMAEKRYMNEAAEKIGNKLTEIRRQGYREDPSDTPPLLYRLGYDGFRSPEQVEALLIKAIHHAIHNQDDRELLLMAFRLLRGYDDATMKDIGDRRRRYVLEHKRLTKDEMIAYQAAEDDLGAKIAALKAAYDRLRKEEDRLIVKLSNMLSVISDIDSYVEDIDDYLSLVPAVMENLRTVSILTPGAFCWDNSLILGRDNLLTEVVQAMQEQKCRIQLTGMGGIGKTEVLNKLYAWLLDHPEEHCYDLVGLIHYSGDIDMDMTQQCSLSIMENIIDIWSYLRQIASKYKVLLLIDDIRPQQAENERPVDMDSSFSKLQTLHVSILFASRAPIPGYISRKIAPLSTDECIQIFQDQHYLDCDAEERPLLSEDDRRQLKNIIENRCGWNTLVVSRLGAITREHCWTVDKLAKELKKRNFSIRRSADGGYGISDEELQTELNKLYNLSKVKSRSERNILEAFTMFSTVPLDAETCVDWFSEDAHLDDEECLFALRKLALHTWLMRHVRRSDGFIHFSMHQIVKSAVCSQSNIREEDHAHLIKRSWGIVEIEARNREDAKWARAILAKSGDTVHFRIQFKNTGKVEMKNVLLRDILPPGLAYLEGSTTVYTGNHPEGVVVSDNILSNSGINIGHFGPGANAWVYFSADVEPLYTPHNRILRNIIQMNGGFVTKTAHADVAVEAGT